MTANDNVIFSYTCEQAIEDGLLVHPFPERYPWLLFSVSVHAAIKQAIEGTERTYKQAAIPLMMDAVMLAKADPHGTPWNDGLEGNVTGKPVWVALNEKGGLTLMHVEDY